MITLEWVIPLGHLIGVNIESFDGWLHPTMCVFNDRVELMPAKVTIEVGALTGQYSARPYFFLLDKDGRRKQTVCLCHVVSG